MGKEKKGKEITHFEERAEKTPWYFRPWVIVAAILSFGPLGLLLLWFRPRTRLYLKIWVSVAVIAVTVWMTVGAVKYYQQLLLHYRELAEVLGSM